jgi:phosphoglycerate kinase
VLLGDGRVLPTLDDLDARGRAVLVRVDFNVPLRDGRVADDTRLRSSVPTLQELRKSGARTVMMSHLGRPDGIDPSLRMTPVGAALSEILGHEVVTLGHTTGLGVSAAVDALQPGEALLLENLRFDPREKSNDEGFARELADLADVYVNDAFGTAHRAAASTVGVTRFLPAYAGRLMANELRILSTAVQHPERPFVAVFGGAKISDKLGVLDNLLPRADRLLVGGGMANTLLAARGTSMGDSLVEATALDAGRRVLQDGGEKLRLPIDLVIADAFDANANTRVVSAGEGVPTGWRCLDIGPATRRLFMDELGAARTVVWNGPMGVFEMAPFAEGTFDLARAIADLAGATHGPATTIVGGGDSAAALAASGRAGDISWISTGGGAMLALLAGEDLPAVEALLAPDS